MGNDIATIIRAVLSNETQFGWNAQAVQNNTGSSYTSQGASGINGGLFVNWQFDEPSSTGTPNSYTNLLGLRVATPTSHDPQTCIVHFLSLVKYRVTFNDTQYDAQILKMMQHIHDDYVHYSTIKGWLYLDLVSAIDYLTTIQNTGGLTVTTNPIVPGNSFSFLLSALIADSKKMVGDTFYTYFFQNGVTKAQKGYVFDATSAPTLYGGKNGMSPSGTYIPSTQPPFATTLKVVINSNTVNGTIVVNGLDYQSNAVTDTITYSTSGKLTGSQTLNSSHFYASITSIVFTGFSAGATFFLDYTAPNYQPQNPLCAAVSFLDAALRYGSVQDENGHTITQAQLVAAVCPSIDHVVGTGATMNGVAVCPSNGLLYDSMIVYPAPGSPQDGYSTSDTTCRAANELESANYLAMAYNIIQNGQTVAGNTYASVVAAVRAGGTTVNDSNSVNYIQYCKQLCDTTKTLLYDAQAGGYFFASYVGGGIANGYKESRAVSLGIISLLYVNAVIGGYTQLLQQLCYCLLNNFYQAGSPLTQGGQSYSGCYTYRLNPDFSIYNSGVGNGIGYEDVTTTEAMGTATKALLAYYIATPPPQTPPVQTPPSRASGIFVDGKPSKLHDGSATKLRDGFRHLGHDGASIITEQ